MKGGAIGAIIVGVLVLIGALIGLLYATGVLGGNSSDPNLDNSNENNPSTTNNTPTTNNQPTSNNTPTTNGQPAPNNTPTTNRQPVPNNQPAATPATGAGIPAIPARLYKPPHVAALEFGGMYGTMDNIEYNNPVTGTKGCPDGFTGIKVKHASNFDYPLYYCYKEIDDPDKWIPSEGSAEFGGMYGNAGGSDVKNISTLGMSCPTGFKEYKVSGSALVTDKPLSMCYKKIVEPSTWKPSNGSLQFGGMHGFTYIGAGANVNNPTTNGISCPYGFTSSTVLGTSGADWPVTYCSKPWDL